MSRTTGAALVGVDGVAVEVEVRTSSQLPRVDVVGLPEAAVRESAARVRAAIQASGFAFPGDRVTVNLAPAELRKSGAGLDLPIAVGILAVQGLVPEERLARVGLFGELALDGRLRPVRGSLALVLALRDAGCRTVLVPQQSATESALAPGIAALGAPTLAAVVEHLAEGRGLLVAEPPTLPECDAAHADLADVKGQEFAKRALLIAASGGHALLLRGAPGCGKTMLARRLPGLLPPLDFDEALEVTRIHSAAGRLDTDTPIVAQRPFRAPHHTASPAGLLGGGVPVRPGEISLAHRGVLFLDELPEYDRRALESLRQVLEEHEVRIARARGSTRFPADFQLVAAANPCPCGWRGTPGRDCRCDDGAVARYAARISGPLLDRIHLHVQVAPVPWRDLDAAPSGGGSGEARAQVVAARARQAARAGEGRGPGNAAVPDRALAATVRATPEARALLGRAVERLGLSARAARNVLRVARTVADLAGEDRTAAQAVSEALAYRPPEVRTFPGVDASKLA